MKKLFTQFLLACLVMTQFSFGVFAKEKMPDLPDLPPAFDTVLPPDGVDVFSPSTTPAQIAPEKPVVTKPSTTVQTQSKPAQPTTTSKPTVSKPVAQTQPKKNTATAPVKKPVQTVQKVNTSNNSYYKSNTQSTYIIPKGKKFEVRLQQTVSSSTPVGTRISFVSRYPETSTYITIPANTVFKGRVVDSHPPQYTGNGGLIVIEVDQVIYNGRAYEIDAKISIANEKRIFFNNIKGKRTYLQSIPKSIKPGSRFFKKMWRKTKNLAKNENGVEIILTPFTLITGVVVYAVNFVASPVLAIFYKGKSITIPSGSLFTIQLREDAILTK